MPVENFLQSHPFAGPHFGMLGGRKRRTGVEIRARLEIGNRRHRRSRCNNCN